MTMASGFNRETVQKAGSQQALTILCPKVSLFSHGEVCELLTDQDVFMTNHHRQAPCQCSLLVFTKMVITFKMHPNPPHAWGHQLTHAKFSWF